MLRKADAKTLNDTVVLENKQSAESCKLSVGSFNRVLAIFITVLIATIVISLGGTILTTKVVVNPVNKTVQVIEDISRGDLTRRIDAMSKDEIRSVAGHFNVFSIPCTKPSPKWPTAATASQTPQGCSMAGPNRRLLPQVNTVTTEINRIAVASEQQTATTNEIANNIQQISEVMADKAKRIQDNAGAASQLAGLSKDLQKEVGQFTL